VVQNSLSWERNEWLQIDAGWHYATVPSMGYTVIDTDSGDADIPSVAATVTSLENDLLRVQFGDDGAIISVHDKRLARETIAANGSANRLAVYQDLGDAWDFPMDYAEQPPRYMELVSSTPRIDGPRAILEQTYRLGHSELKQEIVLTAGSPRLDFVSHLRWRETQTMLRT
ncbi:MAG: alpha-mannosidase, partial [Victivallales bacterium]|nr:alpha-mannosidase [Victivallales bacterium]